MKRRLLMLAMLLGGLIPVSRTTYSMGKNINIVFIPKSDSTSDFWKLVHEGAAKRMREEENVTLTWRGPSYVDDCDAQLKILQMYTKPPVDAIIIAPIHRTRLNGPIRDAAALGVKIVVIDSAVDDDAFHSFIATDNYGAGKLAAERISKLLKGHGNVLVFRTLRGSASTDDRANGFIDHLNKKSPKIKIIDDIYAGGSKGNAFRIAFDRLKENAQIDGIFCANETSSEGMLLALRTKGLAGKINFVGFDATRLLVDGLEKGEINGLIVQNPQRMGYLGVKAAIFAAKHISDQPTRALIDATMVTLENYRRPEIQTLLFPSRNSIFPQRNYF